MPKFTGVQLLNKVKEEYPNLVRILTTAYADLADNIAAINESRIFGYLTNGDLDLIYVKIVLKYFLIGILIFPD